MTSVHIVFSDDHIIVVNKAPGLLSVPGRGDDKLDSVSHRLSLQFPEVHIVHRLDMATSGIMVFARTKEALRCLQQQFQNRKTDKTYIAIVAGKLTPNMGAINLPMRCDWPNRPKQMVCYEHGKKSLTRWSVLEVVGGNSRLKLSPITGRSHQLRIHCEALGHPILGDNLYGTPYSQTATKELCLHAQSLSFNHPTSDERLTFSSEPDF